MIDALHLCEHLHGLEYMRNVKHLFSICVRVCVCVFCFFPFLIVDLCFPVLSNQAEKIKFLTPAEMQYINEKKELY